MSHNKKRKKKAAEGAANVTTSADKMFCIFLGVALAVILVAVVSIAVITAIMGMQTEPPKNEDSSSAADAAPERFTEGNLIYEITGESSVALYYCTDDAIGTDIVVPSTVRGFTVTSFTEFALGKANPKSLYIPKTVTSIDGSLFGSHTEVLITYEGSDAEWTQNVRVSEIGNEWTDITKIIFENK